MNLAAGHAPLRSEECFGGLPARTKGQENGRSRPGRRAQPDIQMQAETLSPIDRTDWNYDRAAHLLERAGFGGTPKDIGRLAAMTPEAAVDYLVSYERLSDNSLPEFEQSGLWDSSLKDFPVSRPAATSLGEGAGEAMGVRVKPKGARPLQPITNRFFYWLRATVLETRRLAFWWVDRMVRKANSQSQNVIGTDRRRVHLHSARATEPAIERSA